MTTIISEPESLLSKKPAELIALRIHNMGAIAGMRRILDTGVSTKMALIAQSVRVIEDVERRRSVMQ